MSGADGTVTALLPDDWAVIDLEDDDARTTAVDSLVTQQLGGPPRNLRRSPSTASPAASTHAVAPR